MTDFAKLNESIAKLGSALEAFFGAADPPVPPNDQPDVDAAVKQLDAIVASVPAPGTKLPVKKPDAPATSVHPVGTPSAQATGPANPNIFAPAHETPKPTL